MYVTDGNEQDLLCTYVTLRYWLDKVDFNLYFLFSQIRCPPNKRLYTTCITLRCLLKIRLVSSLDIYFISNYKYQLIKRILRLLNTSSSQDLPIYLLSYVRWIKESDKYFLNSDRHSRYSPKFVLQGCTSIFTSRQTTFMVLKSNRIKVGLNFMPNRLSILNGKIPFNWLNESMTSFKLKCKRLFLCD